MGEYEAELAYNSTPNPSRLEISVGGTSSIKALIDTNIMDNITFFDEDFVNIINNPYGNNVCEKVFKYLKDIKL